MLLDDAEYRGEPEAGAFADFFGGEEGFKNVHQVFRRYATTGVPHCQTGKAANPRLGHFSGCRFIQFHHGSFDREITTGWHCVLGVHGQIHHHLIQHASVGVD